MKWFYLTSVAARHDRGSAFAADVDLANKKAPPAPPPSWWDAVTITGYLEGSETGNFANPYNGLNWGRLFDDRADRPMFNQGVLPSNVHSIRKRPTTISASRFKG